MTNRSAASNSVKTIRFIRRGALVSLPNVPPDRTLLELLREDLACTGTKEGCGEGDCGACTVVVAEPEASGASLRYRAINSCIRLAHSIDGMALWTVDDLTVDPMIKPSRADGGPSARRAETGMDSHVHEDFEHRATTPPVRAAGLHPAQEAMVQCHGSQCGFCTPGFVMSLFGMYQNHIAPTLVASRTALPPEGALAPWGGPAALTTMPNLISRTLAQEELSGNLCRCTGYRPILDAAQQMQDLPPALVDERHILGLLESVRAELVEAVASPSTGSGRTAKSYMLPHTLAELLDARAVHPGAQVVAGCTDVGLWVTKQYRQFDSVLDVTRVRELRRIEDYQHHIAIGAAVPLADAFAALVKERPQLHSFATRFAGLPVRNSGTLGGNVANGSPIGDSMPLLIALHANVVLMSVRGHRELPLEKLYTGYRQNVMAPDEVLAWIKVPKPTPGEASRVYKISKRYDDDISAVCLAINLQIKDGVVASASIGAGGVAATPVRALKTEAALTGNPWNLQTVQNAMTILRAEFSPISDMRASAAYRREVLGNLLQRYWLESQGLQAIDLATTRQITDEEVL